ncbi:NYN domain-containing protein [Sphingomonas sp. UV9]|uniref:NYN domain-containing protein n=1 Tax=Sphingomonas sp. UV9 TaxID=1851410 RepID=UPI000FFBEA98|nr:NYN domain-containing protein [Sphingomonas sp. UV9]RXD02521.1 NYN domain-containing protein [Sphingomonas sp. UV9]
MIHDSERRPRLAVLIDADNASSRIADRLFEEIAAIGDASVRRVYGDFSGPNLKGWVAVLSKHAIIVQQNFAHTTHKNASDIALVIDAMDLLHSSRFDAFCLVSSDSDFTRLASRIREQGIDVYGFGETKTPESFRNACKQFTYTEVFFDKKEFDQPITDQCGANNESKVSPIWQPPSAAVPHIQAALDSMDDQGGWYFLGSVGSRIVNLKTDFDHRHYGYDKLLPLIKSTGAFDVDHRDLSVYIKPIDSKLE